MWAATAPLYVLLLTACNWPVIMAKADTKAILQKVRDAMQKQGLAAYAVTPFDAHFSENVGEADDRVKYVSGFTGDSALAIITMDKALIWVDSRFYISAPKEMDDSWTMMKSDEESTPSRSGWLADNLKPGSKVGIDPNVMPYENYNVWETKLQTKNISFVPDNKTNLIDSIWDKRPAYINAPLIIMDIKYTGKEIGKKVEEVREAMKKQSATILVVTELDDVAYMINLRGGDIPYTPVFYAYLIITVTEIHLFTDEKRITPEVKEHFKAEKADIIVHPYADVQTFLGNEIKKTNKTDMVWIADTSAYSIASLAPPDSLLVDTIPVKLMKNMKNEAEIKGMTESAIRDSAALVAYLSWLEREVKAGRNVDEISGAQKLEEFRKKQEFFIGLSFPTISAVGPNAAMAHYEATNETVKPITATEIYLLDSGAQYRDGGTTDVTRTMHFGTPTAFEKDVFTRVFKGVVDLATTVFPNNATKGQQLDSIARRALWQAGLNFEHGTGHGIGSFLDVHESYVGVWPDYFEKEPNLQIGMFLSDEPGYYEENKFGVRIENDMYVVPAKTVYSKNNVTYLTFKTITLVPIQVALLDLKLLTAEEKTFLNDYHKECLDVVGPVLKKQNETEAYEWLVANTKPVV